MSCSFIVIPGSGLAARVIDHHPTPEAISDAIGGALAVPIFLGRSGALWVRETGATEGLERNIEATLISQVVNGDEGVPILGPAVLTQVVWTQAPTGATAALAEGWHSDGGAQKWAMIVGDLRHAIEGHDAGFSDLDLDAEWAGKIRRAAAECRRVPIPDGWPYYNAEAASIVRDPVWRGLAAPYDDGRVYVPLPQPI